ncbi:MAG: SurA N-terminal domain-containing protein [Alphaproteobacteria bacterium]|nr:SurA N-terminal domain-containing protein [Alphaproteobacteria bacterium]
MRPGSLALAVVLALALWVPAQAVSDRVLAVVDGVAISKGDVEARARLMVLTSPMRDDQATRSAALESLITETLQRHAAQEAEVTPDEAAVQKAFADIARRNGHTPEQFRAAMRAAGVAPRTLEKRLEAELAWAAVVERTILPTASVSAGEVDAALARAQPDRDGSPPSRAAVSQAMLRAEVERLAAAKMRALRAQAFVEQR